MSEEHDSWFKSAFGVDLGESLSKIEDQASAALASAASGVSQVVQGVEETVGQATSAVASAAAGVGAAASGAVGAASSAAKKVARAFIPGAASGPMADDCKPVRGQVPGPAEHVLCGTHGHILDLNAKQIIAASLADYKAGRLSGAGGAAGVLGAVLPGLPLGVPGLPPGFPGGNPGIGPFPRIPGDGSGGGSWTQPPAPSGGPSGGGGVATTAGEVGQIAMEGIALFDALLIGGLAVVAGGVIVGLVVEVQSSEEIAALPQDVNNVTATMVAGYRTAMLNGAQPGDPAGSAGWLLGRDIATKLRAELGKKNPDASEPQILAALASVADKGAAAAEPILRKKAQESVWISYASKHQDSKWKSYLNERFRAWGKIFGTAPQGNEKLWKDYLNEHSNMSNPLANPGGDEDRQKRPQRGGGRQPQPGPLVAPDDPDAELRPPTCATQFPGIDICSSSKGGYGSMDEAAKAQPEYGRAVRKNVSTMDAYKGIPGGENGHATYYDSEGNKLFTLINRPCCMDTDAGPVLHWRWVAA